MISNRWRHGPACRAGLAVAVLALSGCGTAPSGAVQDDFEAENRQVHEMNKEFDRLFLRPVAEQTGGLVPDPAEIAILNAADTWEAPGDVVNYVLQAKPGKALGSAARFAVNVTLGIGGIFDPATALGIEKDPTTFGETMYVWGVPEGSYDELPFLGPSTDRDTAGRAIGTFVSPLGYVLTPTQGVVLLALGGAAILVERGRYSDTFDSILYDSADSYAQARLLYMQNRRFELGDDAAAGDDGFEDPYADASEGAPVAAIVPFGFEDPYAE